MSRARKAKKPLPEKHIVPFSTTEEAWFWFIRSEQARLEGARLSEDGSSNARPCEPDDIYLFVMQLHKRRKVRNEHLRVLAQYGWQGAPPDPRVREEERAHVLWDEALDFLSTVLMGKGIVDVDPHRFESIA